jgi:hypothetical protein
MLQECEENCIAKLLKFFEILIALCVIIGMISEFIVLFFSTSTHNRIEQ